MPSTCLSRLLCAALLPFACIAPAQAAPTWFVVAEPGSQQSFLLPLEKAADIAQARAWLADGVGSGVGNIVSATIAAGSDGINRNTIAHDEPLWSWHIERFDGFAELAIELCDGWPGLIEADVAEFIRNTGGRICFWNYRVIAELDSERIDLIDDAIGGFWQLDGLDGHGLVFEVAHNRRELLAGWFTFDPADPRGAAAPRWFTAVGPYHAERAALQVYRTDGGTFERPTPVQSDPVGELDIEFQHCNAASIRYRLHDGRRGIANLSRLLPLPQCPPLDPADDPDNGHS